MILNIIFNIFLMQNLKIFPLPLEIGINLNGKAELVQLLIRKKYFMFNAKRTNSFT